MCCSNKIEADILVGDFTKYGAVRISNYSVNSRLCFGSPSNTFKADKTYLTLFMSIPSKNIDTNFALRLVRNSYSFKYIRFIFEHGSSPTRIYGDVDTLVISGSDTPYFNYHLLIQRTYFSSQYRTILKEYQQTFKGIWYLISSYGEVCRIVSEHYFVQMCSECVNNIIIHNITSECTRSFTKNDEDNFNSFIVTTTVSLLSSYSYFISLSTNNYIIRNNYNPSKTHTVYTYPNQWLKYESTNQTTLNIYRKKEPYQRIEFTLTIGKSNEGTVTIIKEVEDSDKSISTVIISSSKPLSI
ncbi:hypothetical protein ENUP19_0113G0033 [Entamoeba nuttalli]|uniref:Uncharacterized protein n=1 Tax=Entamoeba nuttalli TaxID=412467 RepID=A0ABQ0DI50_9EUKA